MIEFYDNVDPKCGSIERVYMVPASTLENVKDAILIALYKSVLGWVGFDEDGLPFWFGLETEREYLCISFEPSGLLVAGEIASTKFEEWHQDFYAKLEATFGEVND